MESFSFDTHEGIPVHITMEGEEVKLSSEVGTEKLKISEKNTGALSTFLQGLAETPMSRMDLLFEVKEYIEILEKGWSKK